MRIFFLTGYPPWAILPLPAMNTKNETSVTRAADPVPVFIAGTLDTSTGSVALGKLENGEAFLKQEAIAKPYLLHAGESPASEAQDAHPVASGTDSLILCRWCGILVRFGHGPVEYVSNCAICEAELSEVSGE